MIFQNDINLVNNKMAIDLDKEMLVVHPLFDKPEEKLDPDKMGKFKMNNGEKFSLIALRIYLIFMMLLAIYRTLDLAGLLH